MWKKYIQIQNKNYSYFSMYEKKKQKKHAIFNERVSDISDDSHELLIHLYV